mmetsp:Transcript_25892/g.74236  ORF Transcript_25892/g.74236 Transcript_25892/m.74236 type:complete len:329 (+) Transcript_25892:603-1589(+)
MTTRRARQRSSAARETGRPAASSMKRNCALRRMAGPSPCSKSAGGMKSNLPCCPARSMNGPSRRTSQSPPRYRSAASKSCHVAGCEGEVTRTWPPPLCSTTAAAMPSAADFPRPRRPETSSGLAPVVRSTASMRRLCSSVGTSSALLPPSWGPLGSVGGGRGCTVSTGTSSPWRQSATAGDACGSASRPSRRRHQCSPCPLRRQEAKSGVRSSRTPPPRRAPQTAPKVSRKFCCSAFKTTTSNSCPIHSVCAGCSARGSSATSTRRPDARARQWATALVVVSSAQCCSPARMTSRRGGRTGSVLEGAFATAGCALTATGGTCEAEPPK